jgi:hypothetical protein
MKPAAFRIGRMKSRGLIVGELQRVSGWQDDVRSQFSILNTASYGQRLKPQWGRWVTGFRVALLFMVRYILAGDQGAAAAGRRPLANSQRVEPLISSPMAGNTNTSSSGSDSAINRLSRTLANNPPSSASRRVLVCLSRYPIARGDEVLDQLPD